jgi:hypothetical protein
MAQEISAIAQMISDPDAREEMDRVAKDYERMASDGWVAQQRHRDGDASPSEEQPS